MEKFERLIGMCKVKLPITSENVGEGMFLVDRGSFQLIIPSDNTEEHGDFLINSIQGHDNFSYNTESTHVYHVLDGSGKFIIDDEEIVVQQGDVITITPNKVFCYEGEMVMTLGMTPNFKEENEHIVKQVTYKTKSSKK